jgi:peptidoglycan/LPS O-acetylase OafA/YrhL
MTRKSAAVHYLQIAGMVVAGVCVLLAGVVLDVKSREAGHPGALLWIDVAFMSIALLIAVAATFKQSRRRLKFWVALLTIVGAQVGVVLQFIPPTAHIPAIWGGLVTYGEFIAISDILSRLGFR